jgi:hypothetical protein
MYTGGRPVVLQPVLTSTKITDITAKKDYNTRQKRKENDQKKSSK